MVDVYDVIKIIRDNIGNCGLAEGSEHYVAYKCDNCEVAGIIVNGGTGEEVVLFVPFKYMEVIGEANSNMTKRYIDEVASNFQMRICNHQKA